MTTEESAAIIAVQVANVDRKLDAIHESLKEDVAEVKTQTERTNGRVTSLERGQAVIKGIGLACVAMTPFAVFALQKLL